MTTRRATATWTACRCHQRGAAARLKRDQCIGGRIAEETQLDRLSVEQVQRLQAALDTTNRLAALTAG